jgi:hypothetical protein
MGLNRPVLAKALELFLANLTLEMAKVAEARNLKKVEQWHLCVS